MSVAVTRRCRARAGTRALGSRLCAVRHRGRTRGSHSDRVTEQWALPRAACRRAVQPALNSGRTCVHGSRRPVGVVPMSKTRFRPTSLPRPWRGVPGRPVLRVVRPLRVLANEAPEDNAIHQDFVRTDEGVGDSSGEFQAIKWRVVQPGRSVDLSIRRSSGKRDHDL